VSTVRSDAILLSRSSTSVAISAASIGYVDPNLATYPLVHRPRVRVRTTFPGPPTMEVNFRWRRCSVSAIARGSSRNPSAAWRHYDALQVIAGKRQGHSWQNAGRRTPGRASASTVDNVDHTNLAQGTLSAARRGGGNLNVARQGAGEPTFGFNEAKALASWRAPWWGGFLVSTVGRWQTGGPVESHLLLPAPRVSADQCRAGWLTRGPVDPHN
jgi:hypothetical protein